MYSSSRRGWTVARRALIAVVAATVLCAAGSPAVAEGAPTSEYVVSDSSGLNGLLAITDLLGLGGDVLDDLTAANGLLATLTDAQVTALEAVPGVTVTPNFVVQLTSGTPPTTESGAPPAAVFPQQTGAVQLWARGDTGQGINVAVLDTGIDPLPDFAGRLLPGVDLSGGNDPDFDAFGHGTFVAGLIAGDGATSQGQYEGEAPGAGLVPVKLAGATGATTLATVIEGVGWVIAHQASEDIRVMNMSLGYVPDEPTMVDPLDQAVEAAWRAGIVVVVSAGNAGPFNGTVLSPGDDPYVITVGAVNDHGQTSPAEDTMAAFSSVGPTNPDGWFKPDIVTSGTSVVSLMAPGSTVATQYPEAEVGNGNFVGSGTSFSTAITSGAVALMLTAHPSVQPDQVKAAILGTAAPGPVGNPFVDGHGLLDVAAAAAATGLSVDQGPGLPAAVAQIGATVNLGSTWANSTWDASRWTGLSLAQPAGSGATAQSSQPAPTGSAWDGSAWDGSAWDGSAWDGSTWDGSTWDGSTWEGSAWDGSAWEGSAWEGSAWEGSAWEGASWGTSSTGT